MPYRTELRRPDLKGVFKCSLCNKIFCHSSSLSRHRMQAHFKSYTCTLCNKEITSNETLRAHMYRNHQISRMFMCRCCNWAFPDKTSLHIHVQAMASGASPGNVAIIAKSTASPDVDVDVDGCSPTPDDESPPLSACGNPLATYMGGNSGGLSTPSSIYPAMPSREELCRRLRERALLGTVSSVVEELHREAGDAVTGQDQRQQMMNKLFGAGAFGGIFGDGNNNSLSHNATRAHNDAAAMKSEMFDDEENDDEEFYEEEDMEDMESPTMVLHNGSDHKFDLSDAKGDEPLHPLLKPQFQMPQASDAVVVMPDDGPVVRGQTNDDGLCEPPPKVGRLSRKVDELAAAASLPILRSAISSSPMNSLMYQKKLNSMLRKGASSHGSDGQAGTQVEDGKRDMAPATPTPPPVVDTLDNVTTSSSDISPSSHQSSHSSNQISPTAALAITAAMRMAATQENLRKRASQAPFAPSAPCMTCSTLRGQLAIAQNRNQFLESKVSTLESKSSRMESRMQSMESNSKRCESEEKRLRDHCESLEHKMLQFQEKMLRFMESQVADPMSTRAFLQSLLDGCRMVHRQ